MMRLLYTERNHAILIWQYYQQYMQQELRAPQHIALLLRLC